MHLTANDGTRLYCEETGTGTPIVFVHEFAGDCRSYEAQVRHFSRMYRCITYNARGYPPSDVPEEVSRYSQARACDDIRDVMDGLGIEKAHVVGISMGGFATFHFGLSYPERALSLVIGGCGYGAEKDIQENFRNEALAMAGHIRSKGMAEMAKSYGLGPARVQLQNKDPRGWQEFTDQLAEHSAIGSAATMEGVQASRPSVYDFADAMARVTVPALIVIGDEDEPAIDASLFMKRNMPSSALYVLPRTGHAMNLEEPGIFNQTLQAFFQQVDQGRWEMRDARSVSQSILGNS